MPRTLFVLLTLFVLSGLAALLGRERPLHAGPKAAGSVRGRVIYRGKIPKARYPDDLGRQRPLLQVDDETAGLRYAVVYLEPADDNAAPERKDGATAGSDPSERRRDRRQAPDTEPIVVDQRDTAFVPHAIAVLEGQTVEFTNNDAANHNVRSAALDRRNQFNVLTPTGGSYKRTFVADPKQRPIRLGCEIHAWMRAWIYVFDHPHFDVTSRAGSYTIGNVPPGNYRLELRQPDGGLQAAREVHVNTDEPVAVDFHFTEEDLSLDR